MSVPRTIISFLLVYFLPYAKIQSQLIAYKDVQTSLPGKNFRLYNSSLNDTQQKGEIDSWGGTIDPANLNNLDSTDITSLPAVNNADCTIDEDFDFQRTPCAPYTINFRTTSKSHSSIKWLTGDGNSIINQNSIIHVYPGFGTYEVKMILSNATCTDTISKMISLDVVQTDMVITPNTTICRGTTKQLQTRPALSFCWSPVSFLDDPTSPNPVSSSPDDITYYFYSESAGSNLIVNGNFSAGNSGFVSGYNFAVNNVTEGQYFVGPNPKSWNVSLSNCTDHSTANGNMMLINGSPVPDVGVWKQIITVTPNTNYAFSTWIQALWPPNPAQLNFSINGNDIGKLITASVPTCTWTQFYTTWNSGDNTTATISIVNKNTQVQGNDFALDDISFAPVVISRDSVVLSVEVPRVKTTEDTVICPGKSVELHTVGAATYLWAPQTGLSGSDVGNPFATPLTSTQYVVTGTTLNGCSAKDTVSVDVFPRAVISISNDTAVCGNAPIQLFVHGGVSYLWTPSATLSNASVSNPIATPIGKTIYRVEITDLNNCMFTDSIVVNVRSSKLFEATPDVAVCEGSSLILHASGGDAYLWTPSIYLDDPTKAAPSAKPLRSTQYTVTISDTVCNYDSVLAVSLTVNTNPKLTATRSNDIDCSNPTSQLLVTGAVSYTWSPASAVNQATIPNPIASIDTSAVLVVTGRDQFGCQGIDSVILKVSTEGKAFFAVPNAFTPNSDGINDCFGIRHWGNMELAELSIYNRWGELVFTTKNPYECWNGYHNGIMQKTGGYAYVIRASGICGKVFKKGIVLLIR